MNSDRLTGETDLAYEYYKIYRDMPPAERSLRTLCGWEVTGKKDQRRFSNAGLQYMNGRSGSRHTM